MPLRGNQWGDKLLWTATSFICYVVVSMPGCHSKPVYVQIWACAHVCQANLYKCAALPIYGNWMLWSICVLLVYLLLVALMACYPSKPVFKRFLMSIHMHHPSHEVFSSHNNSVKVSCLHFFFKLKVIWALLSLLSYTDVWRLMSAALLECILQTCTTVCCWIELVFLMVGGVHTRLH